LNSDLIRGRTVKRTKCSYADDSSVPKRRTATFIKGADNLFMSVVIYS